MSTSCKIDELTALLKQAPDEVFLQPHNVPDPDAIASCFGLQRLLAARGVESVIVYENEIEKANSLKMLNLFGIEMKPAGTVHTLGEEDWAVLVDAQKGTSNLTDLATDEVACIDHHEYQGNKGYRFEDIRPQMGSCSAIVADYHFECGAEPDTKTATALLYGIFMDTDNLTRGVDSLDIDMFYKLYGYCDINIINELKGNQISRKDLDLYADAFKSVEIYDELGFLRLESANDSLLGAAGDMVLTIAGVNIVVAYSLRQNGVKFSTRSIAPKVKANDLIRYILENVGFGGGHDTMAGGFLPLENLMSSRELDTFVKHRAISYYERFA